MARGRGLSTITAASLLALAAACTLQPAPDPGVAPPDTCGASRLQHLLGQPLAAFDAAAVTGPLRLIGPDTGVTMDYSEDRLNVTHSRDRIIETITCG
jgi:hypothetical protein